MQRRIRLHPPAHHLIAPFIGYEPPKEPGQEGYMTAEAAKALMDATGGTLEGLARLKG